MLTSQPGPRDRRLLSTLLILAVVAVFFFIVEKLSLLFFYFGDILLTFFLAWLLAFIISPVVTRIVDAIPRLPRAAATVLVYSAVVLVLVLIVVVAAGALATSIAQFAESIPDIKSNLPAILGPWQQWLNSIGLNQIDLVAQAEAALGNLDTIAAALVAPAPADRGGQPRRRGDAADRVLPVDLHGPRPRRRAGLPVPDRAADLLGGGAPPGDLGLALVRRLPARPGADGRRLLPGRARHQPAAGPAAGRR